MKYLSKTGKDNRYVSDKIIADPLSNLVKTCHGLSFKTEFLMKNVS